MEKSNFLYQLKVKDLYQFFDGNSKFYFEKSNQSGNLPEGIYVQIRFGYDNTFPIQTEYYMFDFQCMRLNQININQVTPDWCAFMKIKFGTPYEQKLETFLETHYNEEKLLAVKEKIDAFQSGINKQMEKDKTNSDPNFARFLKDCKDYYFKNDPVNKEEVEKIYESTIETALHFMEDQKEKNC